MSMVAAFLGEGNRGLRRPATSSSSSPNRDAGVRVSPPLTLEPAIDGPPSPERIRAYTEQMKKAVAASHSRTHTSTSTTSSFGSDTGSKSPESGLSRQSSKKSLAGMSIKADRPDSIQIFGKSLFSRGSKKSKSGARLRASTSLSLHPRDSHYLGTRNTIGEEQSFKKHLISGPYNFQHVVHTKQEHLPNVDVASRQDLLEFSTVRRSNAPRGELKGIRAEDLHFENFSSEAVDAIDEETDGSQPQSPNRPRTTRKPPSPIQTRPMLRTSRSHDNVRAGLTPPPRPPRSPMTQACPISLPPRTSSRTASMIWDEYDPLATTSLERPHYSSGFRRPQAFHLPLSPPIPTVLTEQAEDYFTQDPAIAPRAQENEGWPFLPSQTSPSENQLADVPEEEEHAVSGRRSRMSTASADLRASKSVPNLLSFRRSSSRNDIDQPHTPTLDEVGPNVLAASPKKSQLNVDLCESWEDDIDYCYEHEAEADCDYNWERRSMDTEVGRNYFHDSAISTNDENTIVMKESQPAISLHSASASISRRLSAQIDSLRHLPDPQISPPSPTSISFPLPELSPSSHLTADSPTSLRTPHNPIRPSMHLRSPSQASSFKESQGFTLSPSLLIPIDYATQMRLDAHRDADTFPYPDTDFLPLHAHDYAPAASNRVSAPESTTSFRSSTTDGLRASGSSSSTSLATGADDAELAHRSVASSASGSVPDLVASARWAPFCSNPFSAYIEPVPMPETAVQETRMGDEEQSVELALQMAEERLLPPSPAPCAQSLEQQQQQPQSPMERVMQAQIAHGRKGSVPLLGGKFGGVSVATVELPRRARASTLGAMGGVGKGGRASYGLFPAVGGAGV